MTIIYSADDPISARWIGVGRLLTAYEVNYNFYQHETRISTLEANYTLTVSLDTITQPSPSTLLFTLTDTTTFGPFTIPVSTFQDRGDWEVDTAYLVNDTFNAPDGGLYRVIFDHTSDAISFDPNDNDGAGHDYYAAMIPPRGNTIAAGGAIAMYYRKNSETDYDANWAYLQATETVFSPSTASSLISTNVADALEELEGLIPPSIVDASDVTFTPSTGSSLTSTNVADALEELEAEITSPDLSGYLPLSGGTLTGSLILAADPATSLQAATKQYVDGIALNLGKRQSVRAASTGNVVIASGLNSGDVIDGVTLATSDLVLLKNQSTAAQNGIYLVDVSPVRFSEFDTYDEHPGSLVAVQEGTANADTIWLCTSNAGGTLNTTPIVFSQSSSAGSLLALNNLSDVPNPTAARANLSIIEALSGLTDVNVTEGAGIDGYALKWNNATSKWIAAVSTGGTTYSAGAGLDLTGTTFSVNNAVGTGSIEIVIDGGGIAITTGLKGYLSLPFAGTITEAKLLGDQSGSIVVDVWKCSYAQYDAGSTHPVAGDKITASAPPTISAATKSQDTTLTGWTTAFLAGDILAFNVNSAATIQRATLSLKYAK